MVLEWLYKIVALLFLLVAVILIIRGIRAAIISRFKVYLAVGALFGFLMLVMSFSSLATNDRSLWLLTALVFCLMPLIDFWMIEQQAKIRAAFPDQWTRWENRVKQAGRIDRMFLCPIIPEPPQPISDVGKSAALSSKGFRIVMGFMAVIGLIGLALILLFVLSRKGF